VKKLYTSKQVRKMLGISRQMLSKRRIHCLKFRKDYIKKVPEDFYILNQRWKNFWENGSQRKINYMSADEEFLFI